MTITRLIARPLLASIFVAGGINALRHTDRTLLLHAGRVDQLGPSQQVLTPATIRRVYNVETEEGAGPRFSLVASHGEDT